MLQPPVIQNAMPSKPVLIIGAGVVGLSLANGLKKVIIPTAQALYSSLPRLSSLNVIRLMVS